MLVAAALVSSPWLAGIASARASTEPAASEVPPPETDTSETPSTEPEPEASSTEPVASDTPPEGSEPEASVAAAAPEPPPQSEPVAASDAERSPTARVGSAPRASALAFGRGPYLELGAGSSGGVLGGSTMGIGASVGGGYLLEGNRARRLRGSLGVHATTFGTPVRGANGIFFGSARLGVGGATRRVLAMGHVGVGPAMYYGGSFDGVYGVPQTMVSLSGSLRGRVGKSVGLGIEVGAFRGFPDAELQLYALFGATWVWDARWRKESGR